MDANSRTVDHRRSVGGVGSVDEVGSVGGGSPEESSGPLWKAARTAIPEPEVLDRIVAVLDAPEQGSTVTSVRMPDGLKEATALAVEHLGLATSANGLTTDLLESTIRAAVADAALELGYRESPETRPTLAGVALAGAEIDGSPVATRPDLVERAATEIVELHPDADSVDVLLWAEALLSAERRTARIGAEAR